jgi:hypothetical protein
LINTELLDIRLVQIQNPIDKPKKRYILRRMFTSLRKHLDFQSVAFITLLILSIAFVWFVHTRDISYTQLEGIQDKVIQALDMATTTPASVKKPVVTELFSYIQVTGSCGIHFAGECVVARSGPATSSPVVAKLRNDMVLRIDGEEVHGGRTWYKVIFDEDLLYPARLKSSWYVAADFVRVFKDVGIQTDLDKSAPTSTKRIVVDRSDQILTAFDSDDVFMTTPVSTGLKLTPTPRGTFTVFRKTPTRYMQGPLPGAGMDQYYDLPGVPWNLYFTSGGAVIHGAYWHDSFGKPYSHGCVNLLPAEAEKLYKWADMGTKITVKD